MVLNGLDHLADAAPWLKGRRLGLITSTSGVTRMLTSGIDAIHAQFPLTALFGPEHGVRRCYRGNLHRSRHQTAGVQPVPQGFPAHDAGDAGPGRYRDL